MQVIHVMHLEIPLPTLHPSLKGNKENSLFKKIFSIPYLMNLVNLSLVKSFNITQQLCIKRQ